VDLNALQLVTTVNDEVRQKASSAEMVFKIPMLLSFISHIMTLEPGDLVATGTPSGIGPLRAGDTVEVPIAGISRVRNPVRDVVQ
jgi:2-keto-4-pentenoate hydratase/2-oxohepta-3-ene-1,7-dioic acid hydratase in catechol pathway